MDKDYKDREVFSSVNGFSVRCFDAGEYGESRAKAAKVIRITA